MRITITRLMNSLPHLEFLILGDDADCMLQTHAIFSGGKALLEYPRKTVKMVRNYALRTRCSSSPSCATRAQ